MAIPNIDKTTAKQILAQAQQKAYEVSAQQLTDFSPASPVTAILEGCVAVAMQIQASLNNIGSTLERNRLSVFGWEKTEGSTSVGTIEVNLDAFYPEPYILPQGFQVIINNVKFETAQDLTIIPYTESDQVGIISLETGARTNAPSNSVVSYPFLNRVASITLVGEINGGTDQESDEQWKTRLLQQIRQRDVLIAEDDFESYMTEYLGAGSTSVAVGRLKYDDGIPVYQNGYVSIFGINGDGSSLNDAQIAQLNSYFARKVALASVKVYRMGLFPVSVKVFADYISGNSPDAIAQDIKKVITDYFRPAGVVPGEQIYNKALERRIQAIAGIKEGVLSVLLNGFAMPQSMPNKYTIAQLKNLEITLTLANSNLGTVSTYKF